MKERTLNRMFLDRFAEGGDAVRYLVPGGGGYTPVTFREAGDASREICLGLMALGLSRGDRVAILAGTRLEWCLADIGGILGGFVTVPVYPSNLPDQVEYILAHSRARVVFVEDDLQFNKVAGSRARLPDLSFVVLMTGDAGGKEGTATLDAQVNVTVQVARQIVDFLQRGVIANAVNVPSACMSATILLRTLSRSAVGGPLDGGLGPGHVGVHVGMDFAEVLRAQIDDGRETGDGERLRMVVGC